MFKMVLKSGEGRYYREYFQVEVREKIIFDSIVLSILYFIL